jgi:hypothetical protein
MRIAALALVGCALAGCATAPATPPPDPPLAPVELSLGARLAGAARELLDVALDPARWPPARPRQQVRVALRLDARDGVSLSLRRALAPGMLRGLQSRVAVLAERCDVAVLDEVLTEQEGRRDGPSKGAARRWRATHVVRGTACEEGAGWRVEWRLLDVATGEIVALTHTLVEHDELAARARVNEGDAIAITEEILAAAHRGDGGALVALLHPNLRRSWTRRAAQRRQTLTAYASSHLAPGTLDALGPVTAMELKPGRVRCEVEVDFARKHRDVDFRYLLHAGRWRLCDLDDYP